MTGKLRQAVVVAACGLVVAVGGCGGDDAPQPAALPIGGDVIWPERDRIGPEPDQPDKPSPPEPDRLPEPEATPPPNGPPEPGPPEPPPEDPEAPDDPAGSDVMP